MKNKIKKIMVSIAKFLFRPLNKRNTIIWENHDNDIPAQNNLNNLSKYKNEGKHKNILSLLGWALFGVGVPIKKESNDEWDKEKYITHFITLAEGAIKDGDMKKAENFLEEALKVSDKTKTVGVTCVYDMLATIAYREGEVFKAEYLLVKVIEKLIEMGMSTNHNTVVNFSLKLARIYSNLGQDNLAEIGFRNCLSIQKGKYMSGKRDEETTTLWINLLFWYGKFLATRKRYREAKQCFDSAYTISAHVKSLETNQVMVILYNLAEASFATGEIDNALRYLLNAVILGKSTKSSDLPMYYTKIGIIYLHKGVFKEAENWCEDGRKTSRHFRDKEAESEANDCLNEAKRMIILTKT